MKLQLSDNLRKFRRKLSLSQEQLADMLGVSSQAVSRWETAATYPDMELLPLLAQIFGCTTDALLGVSAVIAETKVDAYTREIEALPEGSRERISLLRRACTEFPYEWRFVGRLCQEMMQDVSNYAEVCTIARGAHEKCQDGYWRSVFLRIIAMTEKDENVFDFLDHNTSYLDQRRETLLAWRYLMRGDSDLYLAMMQKNRIFTLNTVFNTPVTDNKIEISFNHERRIRAVRANLAYVNNVIGIDEETSRRHPIIGDGIPDMWFITRHKNGFTLVTRLAATGQIDEALDMLEDLTQLIVNLFSLQEGTILSYRIDDESRLDAKISYTRDEDGSKNAILTFVNRVGFEPEGEDECMPIYRSHELIAPVESSHYLTQIYGHPRYKACVERLKGISTK